MPLLFVTTIHPAGVDFYVEDSVPGIPTDLTPRIGSLVINATSGAVAYYLKVAAAVWTEIAQIKALPNGTLGVPMILPVVLAASGAGETTLFTLPARVTGWRVVDFWMSNDAGGAGAGTVTVKRGSDSAVISDAMVPGAADADITRAGKIDVTNNLIATSGTIAFVKAAGFTRCLGWVTITPN